MRAFLVGVRPQPRPAQCVLDLHSGLVCDEALSTKAVADIRPSPLLS